MILRAISLAAGVFLLSACAEQDKVYSRSAEDVRSTLLATDLPLPLRGRQHAAVMASRGPDGTIDSAIADDQGRKQIRFSAKVTEIDKDKTAVGLSYVGVGSAFPKSEQRMTEHPEVKALYLKTMREQIDAELEGRPFNFSAIGPQMMAAAAVNAGSLRKSLDEAGRNSRQSDLKNIEKAYAAEASGEQ